MVTYAMNTVELGPWLNHPVASFTLVDQDRAERSLPDLMGACGLALGFLDDLWTPVSVRRVLSMQRHAHKLASMGLNVALVAASPANTVYSFAMSSPAPMTVRLLADGDKQVRVRLRMHFPGLLLLDKRGLVRAKWLLPDDAVWPPAHDILTEARALLD